MFKYLLFVFGNMLKYLIDRSEILVDSAFIFFEIAGY